MVKFKIYVFFLLTATSFNAMSQNDILLSIDSLSVKNDGISKILSNLVEDTAITPNSHVFVLSFFRVHGEKFLFACCCKKEHLRGVVSDYRVISQQLVGFSSIMEYQTYVFGDRTTFLCFDRTNKLHYLDSKTEWLTTISKIQYNEDLPCCFDNNGNRITKDVPIYITYDINMFKIQHQKFYKLHNDNEKEWHKLQIFRVEHRLLDKPDIYADKFKYNKTQKKLSLDIIRDLKKNYRSHKKSQ